MSVAQLPSRLKRTSARAVKALRYRRSAAGPRATPHALARNGHAAGRRALARYGGEAAACAVLFVSALLIDCVNLSGSGPLWPDAPQYANAGAMIYNWLFSGALLHPFEFAQKHYMQYPAFHIPFHPPVYPGLLALFFALTGGVSYISARIFVALCFAASGCFFYAILRRLNVSRIAACACALLLLTTPEVARWSRDTMSEVPALAFIMAASYFFIVWLKTGKLMHCALAFALAEMAFLSRVTTAGILPAWFLYAGLTKQWRKLLSPPLIVFALLYLSFDVIWTLFVKRFARYETGGMAVETAPRDLSSLLAWEHVSYYFAHLPAIAGWGTLLAASGGLIYAVWRGHGRALKAFGLAWFVSYCGFLYAMRLVPEPRYFFFALPGLAALSALLFTGRKDDGKRPPVWVMPVLLAVCLLANAYQLSRLPQGLVGYDAVARRLASLREPGNIMLLSWQTQDLIFRYQAEQPASLRSMIRGDRTLAIRLSDYGGFSGSRSIAPLILARSSADVLDIIRRGRVRYLLTCAPDDPQTEDRTQEMILAHPVAQAAPESFALVERFPLRVSLDNSEFRGQVFLWEYRGELPEGPSELPVIVPTANMIMQPGG